MTPEQREQQKTDCTCLFSDKGEVQFSPSCPYHGDNGTMVVDASVLLSKPTSYERFDKWPPQPTVDISLTPGQAMVVLACMEDGTYPLAWGRNRRAAIRAKILAKLPADVAARLRTDGAPT